MRIYKGDVAFVALLYACIFLIGVVVGLGLNTLEAERQFRETRNSLEKTLEP